MWVALFTIYILNLWKLRETNLAIKVVIAVVSISVGWEAFELLAGIPREANYVLDTGLDLSMDAVGAFAGFMTGKRILSKNKYDSE